MPGKARKNLDGVFGALLRRRRTAAGLSQEALGHKSGCHPTFISLLERGKNSPSLATLMALARALGVRASELVKATEDALR